MVNKAELAALSDAQGCIAMDPLAQRLYTSNVNALQALTLILEPCRDCRISKLWAYWGIRMGSAETL